MTRQSAGSPPSDSPLDDDTAAKLVASLPLDRKVRLLTGGAFWRTAAEPAVGLESMLLSDGPSGVRGEHWDEREPSLNLPSGSCLAAAWDRDLAYRFGQAMAAEARAKGVHVALGPTVNLHRSPLGGRHFECFSEDPLLSGALAAGYVHGLQDHGVAAVPKHYVANDSETDRLTVDARIDERTLREVYLAPFETAVTESGAWGVMSAYNSVNGTTMSEHDLLRRPLCTEWGFDGVVVSDWTAVRSTEASAAARQDLAMPGPAGPWGELLVAAVREGRVGEAAIDEKVVRLLRLASRVGALAGHPVPDEPPRAPEDFACEAAASGMVLLRNERGELPWSAGGIGSVAVSGQAARTPRAQGGGSATVVPTFLTTPLGGLRAALPSAEVHYDVGTVVSDAPAPLPPHTLTNPVTGGPGVRARFLDADGDEVFAEDRLATDLVWFGSPPPGARTLELTTRHRPEESGPAELGIACAGHTTLYADGEELLDVDFRTGGDVMGAGLFVPPSTSTPVRLEAGRDIELKVVHDLHSRTGTGRTESLVITFGLLPVVTDPDAEIARAAERARDADVAVVVVGTTSRAETEGRDRTTLALPGRQDDLVRAVAAANPRTVVVVNAGSPVLMPWHDEVAAVLLTWFPGQDFGSALADVLLGVREPGGRLPTTWPAAEEDVPVLSTRPVDGKLPYEEGLHIGHRAWLRAGRRPAYAFGHGLGYTTWRLADLAVPSAVDPGHALTVTVRVTNTGARTGKQVVQIYLSRPTSALDRPVRWLAGFAPVHLGPGASTEVAVELPARAFAHWDTGAGAWAHEPGAFLVHAGTAADDTPLTAEVRQP